MRNEEKGKRGKVVVAMDRDEGGEQYESGMRGERIATRTEGATSRDDRWVERVAQSRAEVTPRGGCKDVSLQQLGGRYDESREEGRIGSRPE
jgi:hypothetical protein